MTNSEPGDVVLVSVPFTDQSGSKRRPAVVVSTESYNKAHADLVILPLTSQLKPQRPWDLAIAHWQDAGLLKPSVGKPVLATVEKTIVVKKLGRLHHDDLDSLKALLRKILV